MILPDSDLLQSQWVATTDAWGIPDDLPVPISEDNGVFVPATAADTDVQGYDPWTWAQPARILDHSVPALGPYGEVGTPGKSGALVAEWGGMPAPVRDFQDVSHSVVYSRRQVNYHESKGHSGTFFGPQQNIYEHTAQLPVDDYWSTITLQSGERR